jgi:hypothetical protein
MEDALYYRNTPVVQVQQTTENGQWGIRSTYSSTAADLGKLSN